jgi:hypothetical protein
VAYRTREPAPTTAPPLPARLRRRLATEARAARAGVRNRLTLPRTFALGGREYPYLRHRYSDTSSSERAVELPVALALLRDRRTAPVGDVLEVGNVLTHYTRSDHLVVDLYDHSPGVVHEDIASFTGGPFGLVLSVSTVEHIGWDESPRDLGKAVRAVRHMASLLAPGGVMLVTIPVGYHRFLDDAVAGGRLRPTRTAWMVRTGLRRWAEGSEAQALATVYGWPHAGANAVAFLWWDQPWT